MRIREIRLSCRLLDGQDPHQAGLSLLDALYRQETGQQPPPIARTPRGKPYFPGSPWHFSITHTKCRVFCALAPFPVGIDAEELDRNIDLRLAQRILSAPEQAQYNASGDKRRALLTFWVLKEAAAKRSGEGLRGYPNQTAFSLSDPRVMETDGCLLAVLGEPV